MGPDDEDRADLPAEPGHPDPRVVPDPGGPLDRGGPIARLDADYLDERLGAAARAAIEGSRQGVPHPATWKGLFDPVLRLAGVKSWATFVKGARLVRLEQEVGEVRLMPTRNVGPKEGFEDRPSAISVIPQGATAGAIGAGVRDALARAR